MILIAHRGNYNRVDTNQENTLSYLHEAISQGYDVEVDIWKIESGYFLGHDRPTHPVTINHIKEISGYAWFHAKNYDALLSLTRDGHHVFAHDQDLWTLTSRNIIWSHKRQTNDYGIVCMPDLALDRDIMKTAAGICHDRLDLVEEILLLREIVNEEI
jgi:glycerophosphoryl diester phosphodiesterase